MKIPNTCQYNFVVFIIAITLSCNNINQNAENITNKDTIVNMPTFDDYFDVVNLRQFNDTNEFITRLRYLPAFETKTIIDL